MKLFGRRIIATSRLGVSCHKYLIIKRFKKHFASLHNQEKKLFVFPNTSVDHLSLPQGVGVCKSLNDFKIKALKGGFQRRPELLANHDVPLPCDTDESWNVLSLFNENSENFDRNKRIQEELVEKAVSLCLDIKIKTVNNKTDLGMNNKNEKSKLVLDIGCGDGSSTKPLLAMGYSCVGIDLNLRGLSEFQNWCLRRKRYVQNKNTIMRSQNCKSHEAKHCSMNYIPGNCMREIVNDEDRTYNYYDHTQEFFKVNNSASGFVDVIRCDLRHGLPFRACTFDMAISISFLQWLFYGERHRQLQLFFSTLKSLLMPQGKAVIQFYPRNTEQLTDAIHCAMNHFQGVVIGDYPHVDRGRKLFLVMFK